AAVAAGDTGVSERPRSQSAMDSGVTYPSSLAGEPVEGVVDEGREGMDRPVLGRIREESQVPGVLFIGRGVGAGLAVAFHGHGLSVGLLLIQCNDKRIDNCIDILRLA